MPYGRSYPFLGIPHGGALLPGDIKRISELLYQGAVIVCAKPSRSPGLAGYPQSDAEVKASTLWNGEVIRPVGKGKLHTKGDIQSAIRDFKITPLVRIDGASGIASTPRVIGDAELFFLANSGTGNAAFTASFRTSGKRPELWDAMDGSIRFAPVWRQKDGRTEVDLTLGGRQSVFVVFRDSKLPADHVVSVLAKDGALEIVKARFGAADGDRWMDVTAKLAEMSARDGLQISSVNPGVFGHDPAPKIVKTLEIEYRLGGKTLTAAIPEGKPLSLGSAESSPLHLQAAADGSVTASAESAIGAELVFASGKRVSLSLPQPVAPAALKGPWQIALDSPVDAKHNLKLPSLTNLASLDDPAVKYFSGTASYSIQFEISDLKSPTTLDLGKVHDLARVTLNGEDLGVLWQAPFTLDITSALMLGSNSREIAVTNTWHNRLVGDEQFPADFEWGEDRGERGHALKTYPDWFIKNQPRPEQGRKCFVVWYYHHKDTPLLPAGLLGPVRLIPESRATVEQ